MKDAFTLGSKVKGLYRVIRRPLLAKSHDTDHQSEIWHQNKRKTGGPLPSNRIKSNDNSEQDNVAVREHVWKDIMVKETIMKKDVWDIIPRQQRVTSRWMKEHKSFERYKKEVCVEKSQSFDVQDQKSLTISLKQAP